MNKPSYTTICTVTASIVLVGALSACTASSPRTDTVNRQAPLVALSGSARTPDVYYTVEPGDKLAGIAERVTGNAKNWPVIAKANDIIEPDDFRVGQQLIVPGTLLPSTSTTGPSNSVPTAVAMRSIERDALPDNANQGRGALIGPEIAAVVLTEANPNKRFVLTPLGEADQNTSIDLGGNDHIKVIGSYFPKVVYRSPHSDARLLMRVAPGSTFPLEKLDDGWYRISTEKGVGYLRTEDGEPTRVKS